MSYREGQTWGTGTLAGICVSSWTQVNCPHPRLCPPLPASSPQPETRAQCLPTPSGGRVDTALPHARGYQPSRGECGAPGRDSRAARLDLSPPLTTGGLGASSYPSKACDPRTTGVPTAPTPGCFWEQMSHPRAWEQRRSSWGNVRPAEAAWGTDPTRALRIQAGFGQVEEQWTLWGPGNQVGRREHSELGSQDRTWVRQWVFLVPLPGAPTSTL